MSAEDDFGLAIITGKAVPAKKIGGLSVRDMTIATLEILRKINSPLMRGIKVTNPDELLGDVLDFVYVHSAPEDDVIDWAFLDDTARKKAVLKFFASRSVRDSHTMLLDCIQMINHAVATQVDAEPPDLGNNQKKPAKKKQ